MPWPSANENRTSETVANACHEGVWTRDAPAELIELRADDRHIMPDRGKFIRCSMYVCSLDLRAECAIGLPQEDGGAFSCRKINGLSADERFFSFFIGRCPKGIVFHCLSARAVKTTHNMMDYEDALHLPQAAPKLMQSCSPS
jgi:hypothetical protein